jgi:hypothetical protein
MGVPPESHFGIEHIQVNIAGIRPLRNIRTDNTAHMTVSRPVGHPIPRSNRQSLNRVSRSVRVAADMERGRRVSKIINPLIPDVGIRLRVQGVSETFGHAHPLKERHTIMTRIHRVKINVGDIDRKQEVGRL